MCEATKCNKDRYADGSMRDRRLWIPPSLGLSVQQGSRPLDTTAAFLAAASCDSLDRSWSGSEGANREGEGEGTFHAVVAAILRYCETALQGTLILSDTTNYYSKYSVLVAPSLKSSFMLSVVNFSQYRLHLPDHSRWLTLFHPTPIHKIFLGSLP